jgi:hypothetical protein
MSQFDSFGAVLRNFGATGIYGLAVRFSPSADGNLHFECDPRTGEITAIAFPEPDRNDLDEARARLIAGMVNHIVSDTTPGLGAATQAAIRRGANRPQNAAERLMAQSLHSQDKRFEDSDLANQRLLQARHEEVIAGVRAYFDGLDGNEVTQELRDIYGENRDEAFRTGLARVLAREADLKNPDSGINPDQRAIAQFLEDYGFQSDSRTRAIAANPAIRTQPRGLQRAAFQSMWQAMEKLQEAVETQLHRKLTEDETIDLWQQGSARLQMIADYF